MSAGCIRLLLIIFLIQCLYNLLIVVMQRLYIRTTLYNNSISGASIISYSRFVVNLCMLFIISCYVLYNVCVFTSISIFYNHLCITAYAIKVFKIFSILGILLMYYCITSSHLYTSSIPYTQLVGFYLMSLVLFFINRPVAFIIVLEACNLFIYIFLFEQRLSNFKVKNLVGNTLTRTINIAYYFWASFFALLSYILSLFLIFYCFYTFDFSIIVLLYNVLFAQVLLYNTTIIALFICFFILFFCIKFGFTLFIVWKFKFFTLFDKILFYTYYCYYMVLILLSFVNFYFRILIVFVHAFKIIVFCILVFNCAVLYKFWASTYSMYQFFVISSLINITIIFFFLWSYSISPYYNIL